MKEKATESSTFGRKFCGVFSSLDMFEVAKARWHVPEACQLSDV